MEKKEIKRRNEAIAVFMGAKLGKSPGRIKCYTGVPRTLIIDGKPVTQTWTFAINELWYASSWDWLMPVVEKIGSMGNMITINYYSDAKINAIEIYTPLAPNGLYFETERESKIEAVFLAVSYFCLTQTKQHGKG